MAITSLTYTYDVAMRSLAYTRFGSILGIDVLAATVEESINKGVIICPKGIAQRMVAEKRGENFLEFINIYPSEFAFSWDRNRSNVARRGFRYQKTPTSIGVVQADPIDLTYDMWFWSTSLDKVRLCMEKYIQWQHDAPKLSITFFNNFSMNPDISFNPVVDESAIEDIFNTGKVWVYKMTARIEAWLPRLETEEKEIHKISLGGYDKDEVTGNYGDIVVVSSSQDAELAAALFMFRSDLYGITGVSLSPHTFTVSKDRTADFAAGSKFIVENSTDNDEMYTVVSSAWDSLTDSTIITVVEAPVSEIVNGNIYRHTGTS